MTQNPHPEMSREQREVLVAVVTQLLDERAVARSHRNHCARKALWHARHGHIYHLRSNLKKLGVDPTHIDAILPPI